MKKKEKSEEKGVDGNSRLGRLIWHLRRRRNNKIRVDYGCWYIDDDMPDPPGSDEPPDQLLLEALAHIAGYEIVR